MKLLHPNQPTHFPRQQNQPTKHNAIPRKTDKVIIADEFEQPTHADKSTHQCKDKTDDEQNHHICAGQGHHDAVVDKLRG